MEIRNVFVFLFFKVSLFSFFTKKIKSLALIYQILFSRIKLYILRIKYYVCLSVLCVKKNFYRFFLGVKFYIFFCRYDELFFVPQFDVQFFIFCYDEMCLKFHAPCLKCFACLFAFFSDFLLSILELLLYVLCEPVSVVFLPALMALFI